MPGTHFHGRDRSQGDGLWGVSQLGSEIALVPPGGPNYDIVVYLDGRTIRRARNSKGLTQEDLAGMVGTDADAISRIELNKLRPDRELIEAISRALAADLPGELAIGRRRPKYLELADRTWLYQKLVVEDLTYQRIADLIGCSRQRVHQRAKQFALRRRKKRSARAKKRKKRVIPLKGLLKEKRLRARHNGKLYVLRVYPSGRLQMRHTGKVYNNPDNAAKAVCKQKTDGWTFWRYKNAERNWVPLSTLREQ